MTILVFAVLHLYNTEAYVGNLLVYLETPTHTQTHAYMDTHMHTHMHTYTNKYQYLKYCDANARLYANLRWYQTALVCVCMHIRIHIVTHIHACTYMQAHTGTFRHMGTHTENNNECFP